MRAAIKKIAFVVVIGFTMTGCAAKYNYAPVVEVSGYEAVPMSGVYHVIASDTLYSIAWRYGMDYEMLARNNQIEAPYALHVGQTLYLRADHSVTAAQPAVQPEPVKQPITKQKKNSRISKEPNYHVAGWQWPAHGKVLSVYSKRNKGIDISAKVGAPIYAALPGKVVYAGSGLRGYGNLIIIKHNSQTLSAYAYNKRLFVTEGQWVKKGQKIASMGLGPTGKAMLHFEIRRAGLPVNPLNLLYK